MQLAIQIHQKTCTKCAHTWLDSTRILRVGSNSFQLSSGEEPELIPCCLATEIGPSTILQHYCHMCIDPNLPGSWPKWSAQSALNEEQELSDADLDKLISTD